MLEIESIRVGDVFVFVRDNLRISSTILIIGIFPEKNTICVVRNGKIDRWEVWPTWFDKRTWVEAGYTTL